MKKLLGFIVACMASSLQSTKVVLENKYDEPFEYVFSSDIYSPEKVSGTINAKEKITVDIEEKKLTKAEKKSAGPLRSKIVYRGGQMFGESWYNLDVKSKSGDAHIELGSSDASAGNYIVIKPAPRPSIEVIKQ